MQEIIEEYGEILLAIIGAVGVLSITLTLWWGDVAEGIVYIASGL